MKPFGERLPELVVPPPGPRSRALAQRLAGIESRNITPAGEHIYWAEAAGANVRDADDNVYIDLTAGFSVAAAGHARPDVARAIADQAARLPHGLGDVHPPAVKVRLLERLAELAPGDLSVSILASAGAEAVEAALKTAVLHSGRSGVIAFEGGYHGLTYGALSVTANPFFRSPFAEQLHDGVAFLPYPGADAEADLDTVRTTLERHRPAVGAVIIEPVQGRGGFRAAPAAFLQGLRALCTQHGATLIFDEVYTGFGRTGRWFACQHSGVVPDVMTVGKALTGTLPLSAAVGRPGVMAAWPPSEGEAIHTSTFLGNPVACAAALAQLDALQQDGLVERAAELGGALRARLEPWTARYDVVAGVRGLGLMQGVVLGSEADPQGSRAARHVVHQALGRGVLLLAEGPAGNVLAFTPPLVITEPQLDHAVDVVEEAVASVAG